MNVLLFNVHHILCACVHNICGYKTVLFVLFFIISSYSVILSLAMSTNNLKENQGKGGGEKQDRKEETRDGRGTRDRPGEWENNKKLFVYI